MPEKSTATSYKKASLLHATSDRAKRSFERRHSRDQGNRSDFIHASGSGSFLPVCTHKVTAYKKKGREISRLRCASHTCCHPQSRPGMRRSCPRQSVYRRPSPWQECPGPAWNAESRRKLNEMAEMGVGCRTEHVSLPVRSAPRGVGRSTTTTDTCTVREHE